MNCVGFILHLIQQHEEEDGKLHNVLSIFKHGFISSQKLNVSVLRLEPFQGLQQPEELVFLLLDDNID